MKTFAIIASTIFLFGCFGTEPQKTGKEGKPLPAFTILLTDSLTRIHSREILNDKPFVLFYFSPHCPYCRAQTKTIIENMDNLKNIRFYYLSIYPLESLKGFYKEYDLAKYPNITLGVDSAHIVHDYFEVAGYPYLAIYGTDKKLKKTFMGKLYSSQIIKETEQ